MNIVNANFQELYERHLCRHSQYGINVIHLAAVVGIYLALLGTLYTLIGWPFGAEGASWVLLALPIPYFVVLALNIPFRLLVVVVVFMALLYALFFSLPVLPPWLYPILIVLFYKIQAWSHKVYTAAKDMTEFNKKYKKGPALFMLLSLYELAILLNYLVFDRASWSAGVIPPAMMPPAVGAGTESPVSR